jgi:hypothetical protein
LIGIHRWGDQVSGNTLRDNVITFAGQVYRSAVGVFLGYTTGTTVTHNAIGQLPYTAISVNLGWEGTTYSGATITYNEICQDMGVLDDGGVLYAQLPMTSPSVMKYNYLHDEKTTGGAPLYLDSTAGNWTAQYNVLQTGESTSRNIQNCCGVAAQHNTVQYNYSNGSGAVHGSTAPGPDEHGHRQLRQSQRIPARGQGDHGAGRPRAAVRQSAQPAQLQRHHKHDQLHGRRLELLQRAGTGRLRRRCPLQLRCRCHGDDSVHRKRDFLACTAQ